tara:strand:- start:717 stop:890 length:174 start_codon:yes stop_codon:yes gene_type:complete
MVVSMAVDIVPVELIEDVLESVGEQIDKKLGKKNWMKYLYWISVIVVLSIPLVYYFW